MSTHKNIFTGKFIKQKKNNYKKLYNELMLHDEGLILDEIKEVLEFPETDDDFRLHQQRKYINSLISNLRKGTKYTPKVLILAIKDDMIDGVIYYRYVLDKTFNIKPEERQLAVKRFGLKTTISTLNNIVKPAWKNQLKQLPNKSIVQLISNQQREILEAVMIQNNNKN